MQIYTQAKRKKKRTGIKNWSKETQTTGANKELKIYLRNSGKSSQMSSHRNTKIRSAVSCEHQVKKKMPWKHSKTTAKKAVVYAAFLLGSAIAN